MSKILVIGDSTSSAIGGESQNWLRLICAREVWAKNLEFVDTSAPGVTAGSAFAVLLTKLFRSPLSYKVVILSVGNCDRIRRPYIANRVTFRKIMNIWLRRTFKKTVRLEAKWPKLTLEDWNDTEPTLLDQSVEYFTNSLRLIKLICRIVQVPLVVILPRSNLYFPPAVAANNTKFYSILNHQDMYISQFRDLIPDLAKHVCIANSLEVTDQEFSDDLDTLITHSKERLLCALNNLSIGIAREGRVDDSIEILEMLIQEDEGRGEIFNYNLALLLREKNMTSESDTLFEIARDLDISSYRVNKIYAEQVRQVFQNSKHINLIDISTREFDSHFLDHCHLLEEGQEKLATLVFSSLVSSELKGVESAKLTVIPSNPEILEGDTRTFNEVFGIKSTSLITKFDIPLGRAHALESLEISEFRNLSPTRFIEILESSIFYSAIQMEIKKIEIDIYREIQKERVRVKSLFDQLSIEGLGFDIRSISTQTKEIWLGAILANMNGQIEAFLKTGINSSQRIRSIMSWYFRESLYFGFNSSPEMAYGRNQIRSWKEALSIAYVLDIEGTGKWTQLNQLFRFVLEVESVLKDLYLEIEDLIHSPDRFTDRESTLKEKLKKRWDEINGK
jgi:hypothetical protein